MCRPGFCRRISGSARGGEFAHLVKGPDPDLLRRLLDTGVVGANLGPLGEVDLCDLIGNCILGHRRERVADADRALGRPTFDPEHVVDRGEHVAPTQLAVRPVGEGSVFVIPFWLWLCVRSLT